MTTQEFSQSIKTKYPQYQSVDDNALVAKMIEKYPVYKAQISDIPTDSQATITPQENNGLLGQAADVINKGYNAFTNLPVVKQASQLVGGVVGTAGAVIGGAAGGVLKAGENVIKGKPVTQDVVKSAIDIGKSTADFGYSIGKEGTPAAALGALGKLPNLAVAYSQGYQGVNDIIGGIKENDPAKALQGGIETGVAYMGAKGAASSKGWLINPEVAADIKGLPENIRKSAYDKVYNNTVGSYREILNQTPKEFQLELKNGKDTPKFLADQGIILKSENGKISNTENVDILKERASALDSHLSETFASNPKQFDLYQLGVKAEKSIEADSSILAKDKADAINTIDEYIRAEVKDGGRLVDSQKFNDFKRNLWDSSYSPDNSKVVNDTIFTMGHEAKSMIENAYKNEADIQGINQELGNYSSAIRFLTKSNGRNIKGGMLGKLVYKGIGSIVGATTGHPMAAVAGAEIAGKLSDMARNPALKTGVHQKVLQTIKPKN
jgi:hypothetical protein